MSNSITNPKNYLDNISAPSTITTSLSVLMGGINLTQGTSMLLRRQRYKRHKKEKVFWGLVHLLKGSSALTIQMLQFFVNLGIIAGTVGSLIPIATSMMLFLGPLFAIAEAFRSVNKACKKLDDDYLVYDNLLKYNNLQHKIDNISKKNNLEKKDKLKLNALRQKQKKLINQSQALIDSNKKSLTSKKTIKGKSLKSYAEEINLQLDSPPSLESKNVARLINEEKKENYKKKLLKFSLITTTCTGLMLAAFSVFCPAILIPSVMLFSTGFTGVIGCGFLSGIRKRAKKRKGKKVMQEYMKHNNIFSEATDKKTISKKHDRNLSSKNSASAAPKNPSPELMKKQYIKDRLKLPSERPISHILSSKDIAFAIQHPKVLAC